MDFPALTFAVLEEHFAICRLPPESRIPDWALLGSFSSITRSFEELSVVSAQTHVPEGIACDRGWRCLKLEGPFDLSATGIVASFSQPLAEAGIALFVVSTFDTDYVLIREKHLEEAIRVLSQAGYRVRR